MVDSVTTQFMYKAIIVTYCGSVLGILLYMMIASLVLGDGEAIKIIDSLTPIVVAAIGAMAVALFGSHLAGALIARGGGGPTNATAS